MHQLTQLARVWFSEFINVRVYQPTRAIAASPHGMFETSAAVNMIISFIRETIARLGRETLIGLYPADHTRASRVSRETLIGQNSVDYTRASGMVV